jgi:hypothetical protein
LGQPAHFGLGHQLFKIMSACIAAIMAMKNFTALKTAVKMAATANGGIILAVGVCIMVFSNRVASVPHWRGKGCIPAACWPVAGLSVIV